MKHQVVQFRIPYQADLNDSVLTVAIPVSEVGKLFTEEAIQSTVLTLGKKDGLKLIASVEEEYFRKLVLKQVEPEPMSSQAARTALDFLDTLKGEMATPADVSSVGWGKEKR
jgi:hypothetical protein